MSRGTAVPVRTYQRRAGRRRRGQADALERLWPAWGVAVDGRPLDLAGLFGRTAPVVLEIGSGMGEAAVAMAAAQPERDLLAVDVHTPGHGALLRAVEQAGLTNVRVADGDAVILLHDMLAPSSLAEVRVFFPDPWPKRRHLKRRLVTAAFADVVADRLVDGGLVHVASDWPDYAAQARAVFAAHPGYDVAEAVPWRPVTTFEERGVAAGRPALDLAFVRRARRAGPR